MMGLISSNYFISALLCSLFIFSSEAKVAVNHSKLKTDSPTCCDFDDTSLCGFRSASHPWIQTTYTPEIPPPGSSYVYYELVNYVEPTAISAPLESPTMYTISSDVVFQANVYVDVDDSKSGNMLLVQFYNEDTGITTLMDSVINTNGDWDVVLFYCNSVQGNCCQGAVECNGSLQFVASVDAYGGTAYFAVDFVGLQDQCR